eukprot:g6567.t1
MSLKAPLERAVRAGNRDLAQKLVGEGAEIGEALHTAAERGHGEIVSDLLENGAPIDAKVRRGMTPLHVAAEKGKTEVVQLLLLRGAHKDALDEQQKMTPLVLAARFGHKDSALALMAAGADVHLSSRIPVVQAAVLGGHMEVVKAAIERGANVNAADSHHQDTALHVAAISDERRMIDVLLQAGANIESRDRFGCTPLHNAAGRLRREPLLALLELGADVNAQDQDQDTSLHWAAANAGAGEAAEVVDSLLRSGADETIINDDGKAVMDVVGVLAGEELQASEDLDRVRKLLAKAPADRAWRRRGYLVLCRAHPGKVRRLQDISSVYAGAGMARTPRNRAKKMGRTNKNDCSWAVEASGTDERCGEDWAVAMARVLGLQEEGIFRTIVVHL